MDKPNGVQKTFHIVWIIVGIAALIFLVVMIYVALMLPDLLSGLGDINFPDFGGIFCTNC